jgi:hypothetical protein
MLEGRWCFLEELENGRDHHINEYSSSDIHDTIKHTPASEYTTIYWANGLEHSLAPRNKHFDERKERILYKQLHKRGFQCP